MFSFYHLPSTVVRHKTHKKLNSTYSFYNFSTKTPLRDLIFDALISAKSVCRQVYSEGMYSSVMYVCPPVCL